MDNPTDTERAMAEELVSGYEMFIDLFDRLAQVTAQLQQLQREKMPENLRATMDLRAGKVDELGAVVRQNAADRIQSLKTYLA